MKMETGYANSNSRHHAAGQLATADNPMGESVVSRAINNLQEEVNGRSVQIDMLCGRIGAASRPCAQLASGQTEKLVEPTTSLLTKKIDDQAKRVRMLSNQVAMAIEGLEL